MISARGAYSRLVSPGPQWGQGWKGFHSPRIQSLGRKFLGRKFLDDGRLEMRIAGVPHLLVIQHFGRVEVRIRELQHIGLVRCPIGHLEEGDGGS
jgi:hypothetical protein